MTARPKSEIDKHIAAVRKLQRLTALLEDRQQFAKFLDGLHRDSGVILMPQTLTRFADRIRVYLKEQK